MPVLLSILLLALTGYGQPTRADAIGTFLAKYWHYPLAAQGQPPKAYSAQEASLAPEACGACHVQEYRDWRTALHSHAMGPGMYWQFELLGQDQTNSCLRCHAPLAEQKALVARRMAWPNAPKSRPPAYVPPYLDHDGVVCAACHVRAHVHYGPPGRSGASNQGGPHGGYVTSKAFQDSRFCATCHQFPAGGPTLGGKLRENTYNEWRASSYAPKQTCQSCHMPGGRHLWRGVHDPAMVRKGLAVKLNLKRLPGNQYEALIVVTNKGAGHDLPTYITPRIYLVLILHRRGRPDTELARDVIGWEGDLYLKHEKYDTRIPPHESRHYRHTFDAPAGNWSVELRVDVDPGENYLRMYYYSLKHVKLSPHARKVLRKAISETEAARFTAMRVSANP